MAFHYNRLSHPKGSRMSKPKATDQPADATRCASIPAKIVMAKSAPLTTPIVQTSVFVVPEVEDLRRYAKGNQRHVPLLALRQSHGRRLWRRRSRRWKEPRPRWPPPAGWRRRWSRCWPTCQAGDEIVSMLDVYGGTVKLFEQVLPRCGIKVAVRSLSRHQECRSVFQSQDAHALPGIPDQPNPALRRSGCALRDWGGSARRAWWWTTPSPRRCCRSR